MLRSLLSASHLMPFEQLSTQVAEHARGAGLRDVSIHLCDLQQRVLRVLPGADPGPRVEAEAAIEGSLAGWAFQQGKVLPITREDGEGYGWWVPLLDGSERLGVLRVYTDDDAADDDATYGAMLSLATLVSLLVVSKRRASDVHAHLVRTESMNVAAEMSWHLMPPRSYTDDRVMIAAVMEPAYEASGDAFDFAINGDVAHVAIFDAMGHDTAAGLTANLAVAAFRNNRRQGLGLVDTGEAIEKVLIEQFDRTRYATAILADLDTCSGLLTWVNRGHHPPVIIRGGRWSAPLEGVPAHPLGTDLGIEAKLHTEQLEPGDRVVLYTDGMTESRLSRGEPFGLDRFLDFLIRHHADALPVPETLRRLVRGVLSFHENALDDDATVLVLEWHGPTPYPREEAEARVGLPEGATSASATRMREQDA
ncbi:SpoIIE family protein phosphatase [Streptomyces sp. SID3343]|nr:SpoIIE family protein phosphatase [Streptomyces sp. SID3343]